MYDGRFNGPKDPTSIFAIMVPVKKK